MSGLPIGYSWRNLMVRRASTLFTALGIALGFFALQIVFSHLWLKTYRYGPLEWLWRTLTYGERPAFRLQPV